MKVLVESEQCKWRSSREFPRLFPRMRFTRCRWYRCVPEKDGGRAKRIEEYKWNYNTSSEEGRKSWLTALSAGLKRQNGKEDCSMAGFLGKGRVVRKSPRDQRDHS